MQNTLDGTRPDYQQLADRLAVQLLDGQPEEGRGVPSMRQLALINQPADGHAGAADTGRAWPGEMRQGMGMYVTPGARGGLRRRSGSASCSKDWRPCGPTRTRPGLTAGDLDWGDELMNTNTTPTGAGAPALSAGAGRLNYGKKAALRDIVFTIPKGRVVGSAGHNGAGKTR